MVSEYKLKFSLLRKQDRKQWMQEWREQNTWVEMWGMNRSWVCEKGVEVQLANQKPKRDVCKSASWEWHNVTIMYWGHTSPNGMIMDYFFTFEQFLLLFRQIWWLPSYHLYSLFQYILIIQSCAQLQIFPFCENYCGGCGFFFYSLLCFPLPCSAMSPFDLATSRSIWCSP